MFISKVKAFTKFYFDIAIDNKLALIFTLVFPVIYQIIAERSMNVTNEYEFTSTIMPMTAYIIVSTALNGVTMPMIATRDSGFIKAYYFASGSRWAIYIANLLVQTGIVILEISIFTIFMMVMYTYFSLKIFIVFLITTLIVFPLISLGFNFLLLMPVRQTSLSIIATALLLGLLVLLNLKVSGSLYIFYLVNPYVFIGGVFQLFLKLYLSKLLSIFIVAIVYIIVGCISFNKFDLQDRGRKA
ncbi:hypothetical protein LCB40_03880 [Lactobacillus corticis]|uniref:ABC-2 type transporter domain-containing protein n=2 Tax=Lactobacillus corticis TaxID=2201249 RepID=A0A916QJ47_9LACO|nr:hypothetical protein LCB40_03880 [Lactobacillus corticis]